MQKKYSINQKLNKRKIIKDLLFLLVTFKIPIYLCKLITYYVVNHLRGKNYAKIGKKTNIHPTVLLREAHNIIIGDNCYFNHNTILTGGHGNEKLIIGNNVMTGPNVSFFVANHNFENLDRPINSQGYYEKSIIIEDDVWIGAGTVVTSGVTIGKGCVIGAGSVITHDIPPYSIAAGTPTKVIHSRL